MIGFSFLKSVILFYFVNTVILEICHFLFLFKITRGSGAELASELTACRTIKVIAN